FISALNVPIAKSSRPSRIAGKNEDSCASYIETCAFGNTSLNLLIIPDIKVKPINEGKPNETSTTASEDIPLISLTIFFISRVMDSERESSNWLVDGQVSPVLFRTTDSTPQ